jgi:hypothetical protein
MESVSFHKLILLIKINQVLLENKLAVNRNLYYFRTIAKILNPKKGQNKITK